MAKSKTTNWREVRTRRAVSERAVRAERERLKVEQRAYHLREIREEQGVTQQQLADRMALTQPSVSALESGDLERSGISTLKAYVEALGGTIEVTARFGDRSLLLIGED
jgi:predicted transcriptional regulator